jgi:hypothetical protein
MTILMEMIMGAACIFYLYVLAHFWHEARNSRRLRKNYMKLRPFVAFGEERPLQRDAGARADSERWASDLHLISPPQAVVKTKRAA